MKIGFLVPLNGVKQYGSIYLSIVSFLNNKGHEVVHPLAFNTSMINTWSIKEKNKMFEDYYARVIQCDLVIAECSYPSTSIGYQIANAARLEKEIIILKTKNDASAVNDFESFYSKKNISIFEYQSHDLKEILEEALIYNPNQKYKKYNILFTPEMVVKLNEIAKKKNLPKSVYIRQLLEKGLAADE